MAHKRVVIKVYKDSADKLSYAAKMGLKYKLHYRDTMCSHMYHEFGRTARVPYGRFARIEKITLAWYNGQVIGAAIKCRRSEYAYQAYVKPKFRKKGIGRRLVQKLGKIKSKTQVATTFSGIRFWENLVNKDSKFAQLIVNKEYDTKKQKYFVC